MNAYVKGLRAERSKLSAETAALRETLMVRADGQLTPEEASADDARATRAVAIDKELARYERIDKATVYTGGTPVAAKRPYVNLAEQLIDIAHAETRKTVAPRLNELNEMASASGLSVGVGSEGGYFIQTDFSQTLLERTYEIGQFLNRVNRIPISDNANGLKIPAVDESSRADGSRYGGLRAYWVDEAGTITQSKPKFRMVELNLKKLAALAYVTDELLQDQVALSAFLTSRLPQEMLYTLEDALFNGTGVGKPLGFLQSAALKTVSIISDQAIAANPIVIENVTDMYAAMWPRCRQNAVWYVSTTVEPHLMRLKIGDTPVWMRPGDGATQSPYATLMGRPVIPMEYCPALGTIGDIMFVDPTQYTYIDKGGIQSAQSIHVRFLQDETAYRFTLRCDGQPEWNATLTAKDGTTTYSPFVVLNTRS